jgi:ABC-type amino acid transport substrate-binding protein
MLAFRWLIALSALLHAAAASADLWAYVDAQGHSHVADHRVDARYRLFYKGRTTLDAPSATVAARARAIDALAGTPLYRRATDPARAQRFDALIASNARITGLDAALVKALIAVESGFDPRAVSDKGAIGLMQVLPDTGKRALPAGSVRGDHTGAHPAGDDDAVTQGRPRARRPGCRRLQPFKERSCANARSNLPAYGGSSHRVGARRDCTWTGFSFENVAKPDSP